MYINHDRPRLDPEHAFMVPVAEYLTESEAAEYILGEEVHHTDDDDELPGAGWYGRLSAPGYLDCTEWQGPFTRAWMAIREVCRTYDVDVNGHTEDV